MSPNSPLVLPPLSLYVHVPWCVRKCPYCDFNSHTAPDTLPVRQYLDCITADLRADAMLAQGRQLHSIFFGGGTPSLLPNNAIAEILDAAARWIGIESNAEITLEANPGTVEHKDFGGLRETGVNRLSIGVQSFQAAQLAALGRIHSPEDAMTAVHKARKGGFDNLNLDLMHGLPQQSQEHAFADLHQALALEPEHISWYQLTVEPNTEFFARPPPLPEEDVLAEILDNGHTFLEGAGFQQYEVSAYARDGHRSAHNLNYWTFGDYLAAGPGAHGKITWTDKPRIERYRRSRTPAHYLASSGGVALGPDPVASKDRGLEFMMNALRLVEGFTVDQFEGRTGIAFEAVSGAVSTLKRRQLMDNDDKYWRLTPLGRRFLNNVLDTFQPE